MVADVSESVLRGHSALVVGPRDSGRTAVLLAVAEELAGCGRESRLAAGRDAAAGIPLAAFAPLVAEHGLSGAQTLDVYTRLPGRILRAGIVVLLDDLDLADQPTGVLAAQLARAGVPLVVSACSPDAVPHGLRDAMSSRTWTTSTLGPLPLDDVLALAATRFGEELDVASAARLARSGHGLPGRVVELLEAGAAGSVLHDDGLRLGAGVLTDTLRERAADALSRLDESVRETLDLVCAVGRMPERALDARGVDIARERGLLALELRAGQAWVHVPDVCLAGAVRETLGGWRLRTLRDEAGRRLAQLPGRSPAVRSLHTVLAVRAGACPDLARLHEAIAEATVAHRLDELRDLLAACGPGRRAGELLLLGRARGLVGDLDRAGEDLLAAADLADREGDGELVPEIGHELGILHAVRRQDPAGAVRSVGALVASAGPGAAPGLQAELVKWRLMAGLPAWDPEAGPMPLAAAEASDGTERIGVAVIAAMIGSLDGPTREAHAAVDLGLAELHAGVAGPPCARELLLLSRFLAWTFEGRHDEATRLAREQRDAAIAEEHPAVGMWEFAAAETALHRGRLIEAEALARRAVRHLTWQDFTGLRWPALALLAAVHATLGAEAEARAALALLPAEASADVKVELHLARARALLGQATGAELATTARRALAESHAFLAVLALDDALLLARDHAERSAYAATLAAEAGRSPLVEALARRAQALLAEDASELERAAAALDRVGLDGRAAHTLLAAADLRRTQGAREAERRLRRAAVDLGGPMSNGSRVSPWSGLSAREREIAALAAAHTRSREIAERLGLSVRTVDNHLSRVFRKLGVRGRADLAALAEGEPDAE